MASEAGRWFGVAVCVAYSSPVAPGTSIVVSPHSASAGSRLARRVARALWACATILAIAAIGIVVASLSSPAPEAGYVRGSVALFALAWGTIGGRIAIRSPHNAVGWFMLGAGIGFGLLAASQEFVIAAGGGTGQAANSLSALRVVRASAYFTSICAGLTVLYFPDGRLPSRAWLAVAAAVIVTNALGIVIAETAALPPLAGGTSPFAAIEAALLESPLYGLARYGGPLALVASAGALLARVRRADALERLQLKWIAAAGSLAVVTNLAANAIPAAPALQLLQILSLLAIPTAVGLAMARYRLYDIDVILNRTLVYAIVSGFLAGLTAALTGAIQATFIAITGQRSDAAIVITTLILVGVFVPLREVVQRGVDSRFKQAAKGLTGLRSFATEVRQFTVIADEERLVKRLLRESAAAFDATGGSAELRRPDGLRSVESIKASGDEPQLTATITDAGGVLARVKLGARTNGDPYTRRQVEQLQEAVDAVGDLLRQRSPVAPQQ
jgi:hypothetical protein